MRRFLLNATTLFAAFALSTACSPPADMDAGTDSGPGVDAAHPDVPATDVPRTDGPADAGPPVFGQCTTNAQCGAGGMCLTTFPGGLCTRRCTNDRACGAAGICEPNNMICLPSCTTGGLECDQFGGACVPADATGMTHVCLPACFPAGATGVPSGYPTCPAAMACDPYAGICSATAPMGADDGAACTMDSDCKGNRCITEIDATTGMATGWLGGYCLSFGRTPSNASYMMGSPAPQGSCPAGTAVIPLGGESEGDDGPCLKTCNATADCRPGYQCDHLQPAMGTGNFFSNGVCLPVNCNTAGMACPSGTHCVTQPSDAAVPPGQCESGGTDAGVVDSGVDVVVPVDVPSVG